MYLKNYNLKNKTAVVTGAGKGLGRACAIALAEAGADLVIISRTKKDLDEVSKKIKKLKKKCKSYVCDITNFNEIKEIIDQKKIESEDHNITLFFSPIKRTPLEIMIQKCSEIGISIFQPVIMERTNLKNINFERLNLIAIEACEQSNRNKIPEINKPISFATMINDNSLAGYLYCSLDNNEEKIKNTVSTAIRMLDNVININYYSVDTAKNSNFKHRPIGLGLMGFPVSYTHLTLPTILLV